jgi:hypothetical protein
MLKNIKKPKLNLSMPTIDTEKVTEFFRTKVTAATAETISWIAVIIIHAATIPTMLAVMSGLTEKMPPIDLVLFTWAGLALLFVRATILKDMLNVVTIGFGFIIHAVILSLILFK